MSGPFDGAALTAMLAAGKLRGDEEISADRRAWASVRTLSPAPVPGATGDKGPTPPPRRPGGDEGDADDDGILLAPLEIGFAVDGPVDDAGAAPPVESVDNDADGVDLEAPLELEERRPSPRTSSAPEVPGSPAPRAGAGPHPGTDPVRVPAPARPRGSGAASATSAASATVASLLDDGEHEQSQAHQPLRLDETLTPQAAAKPAARPRTLTAARGGQVGGAVRASWRPSRRLIRGGVVALLLAGGGVATLSLDLPDRLRGEPARASALGATAAAIAQDRFPAFSEGARLLEEAAGDRRHAPATRAGAAELLASSVVIHGGERGRISHAEALLDLKKEPGEPARTLRARAAAWVALAKGRWKDAETIAADTQTLGASDRAVLQGWAALGRENAGRAAPLFQSALAAGASPPAPSRVATLYALARAREADLSPAAETGYRAVLSEAPAHVGAALGLARVSQLSASGRLKLAEAVITQQARDASRVELAEAYALVARAAREQGAADRAEAALKRAREIDPASVAAAVLAGDWLLAEGRTDEAVARYKLALAAPVSAARTPWLRFARVAALIESSRGTEASAALGELDRLLPGDARVPFWRGRAAERAQPPNQTAADQGYRQALGRDPRFLPASLQLARLLLDQHRGADALAVLRRAEKEGAAAATVRVALGQALLASGNATEAVRTFRQAIATDGKGGSAAAHLGLAAGLEGLGDLEGARAELAALSGRGAVPGLGARVAALLVKLGRKTEALAAYRKELDSGGATGATQVAAARLALELGQRDLARTLALAAVSDDPRTPGALLALADVRRADGDLGSALAELRRALAVDGSAEVQLEYGRALIALGRDEDGLSALAQARDLPEAGIERGRIYLRRGDAEGAARELGAAAARLPSQAEAFLLLGEAEDRLGHVPRAESAWKTAVRLSPATAEPRYRLGRLAMDRGQPGVALPQLRAAADRLPAAAAALAQSAPPWWSDLFFQLGFAELRQGGRERALAAFRRYLSGAPADAPARAEVTRQIATLTGAAAATP